MQPNKQPGKPRPIMDMYPVNRPKRPTDPTVHKISIDHTEKHKEHARHQTKRASARDTERPSAAFLLTLLLLLLLLAGGGGAAYYFFKYKPEHKPVAAVQKVDTNLNHITDDTLGLKFAISKDLSPIDKTTLVKENPYFVYGFKQNNVANVVCTISQQKRQPAGGPVAPTALRDGTINGLKKSFPDIKLDDFQDTTLVNGQDAASLILHYTDNKVATKERMVVAATNTTVTFSFCKTPTPLFSFYSPKFNQLFDSLEVY